MQTTKTKNATRNLLRVATAIVSALLLVVGLWGPGQLASADDAVRLPAAPKAGVTVSTTSPITVGNKAYLSGKLTGFSGKVTIKPQVWISVEEAPEYRSARHHHQRQLQGRHRLRHQRARQLQMARGRHRRHPHRDVAGDHPHTPVQARGDGIDDEPGDGGHQVLSQR
ncbi:MAG: hypothetical protein R2722_14125 [Tessaracoccus sp.]